ncbi:hypothetical protein K8I85_08685 [bacterium]|nr:hypothetical protein [bacterium]
MISSTFEIEWRAALSIAIRCTADAVRASRRFALLLPLLPWLLLRGGGVLWLSGFPVPPRDRLAGLWEFFGGPDATGFPLSAAVLPRIVAWCDPLLELSIGVLGVAVVCALLPDIFRGERPRIGAAWGRATRRLLPAWIAAAPGILGAGALTVLADVLGTVPGMGGVLHAVAIVLGVLCRALFAYAVAAVVIGNLSPFQAWRRSATLVSHFLAPTVAIVALAALVAWPWRAAPDVYLGQFHRVLPTWMGAWAALGAVPIVLAALFVTAATVRLYLHGYGAEEAR